MKTLLIIIFSLFLVTAFSQQSEFRLETYTDEGSTNYLEKNAYSSTYTVHIENVPLKKATDLFFDNSISARTSSEFEMNGTPVIKVDYDQTRTYRLNMFGSDTAFTRVSDVRKRTSQEIKRRYK